MRRIIWNDPTTGIASVSTPAYNDLVRSPEQSDDDLVALVISNEVPKNATHFIIDDDALVSSLLTDPLRDALVARNGNLEVDMPRARIVWRRIRNIPEAVDLEVFTTPGALKAAFPAD